MAMAGTAMGTIGVVGKATRATATVTTGTATAVTATTVTATGATATVIDPTRRALRGRSTRASGDGTTTRAQRRAA